MNTLEYYRHLFAYSLWADREAISSVERAGEVPKITFERVAHLVATQRLWFDRVQGRKPTVAVWPEMPLAEARRELEAIAADWKAYLEGLGQEDLARMIDYVNSKGESFTSPLEHILTHVAMHGAYHRGQIAADVRASGSEPVLTDYIYAAREKLVGG